MNIEQRDTAEGADGRVSWCIYFLAVTISGLGGGIFAGFQVFTLTSSGAWFWVAVLVGAFVARLANSFRPRYESTTGRWRAFYDLLLRQLPPPD